MPEDKDIDFSTARKPKFQWVRLKVAGIAILTCLIAFLSLSQRYTVNFSITRIGEEQFSSCPVSAQNNKLLEPDLELCPSNRPPPAKPPARNVWAPLSYSETSRIQAWLESGHGGLNLTRSNKAGISDNSVYNIEVFPPPKDLVLAYLANPSVVPPPPREARVTVHHGGVTQPFVRDYIVGPLPASGTTSPSDDTESSKPTLTIRPLEGVYHREIPYNVRGLEDLTEMFGVFAKLVEPLGEAVMDLFDAPPSSNSTDTFTAGPSGPWSFDGSFRRIWVTWRYNVAGSSILPINFYTYLDFGGTDPSLWKILRVVYHDQIFNSAESFLQAWRDGKLEKRPLPSLPLTGTPANTKQKAKPTAVSDLSWASRKRVGSPRDLDHLPGPYSYSPRGMRFRVSQEEKWVSWMGWSLYLGFDRDMGMNLWDVRFKDERVLYQLAPQEALVQYAGFDPVQSTTAWLDRYFGMGTLVRNLIPYYDCPEESIYLAADTFHPNLRSGNLPYETPDDRSKTTARNNTSGGHLRRDRAICIFEHDTARPLTRHVGDLYGETGAIKGYTLVVRSVAVVGNYDYMFDYIFHLDGTIEVKVSASGYLQGGYWDEKQRNYGYRIREFSMGSLHDHVINFKVDLDIAGTANSVLKTTTSQETTTLPWFSDPLLAEDWPNSNTVIQQRIKREYLTTEDDSRITDWERNLQGSYAVVNKDESNRWGNPRGYAIHPGVSSIRNAVVGSSRLLNNANWAKYHLSFSKRKESEPSSSSMWNLHTPGNPIVNFDKFFDGESLDQEDLVAWVNVGMHHLPHAEDSPNTKTSIAASSFILTPLNYFDSDPSMDLMNAITLTAPSSANPFELFDYDDNGVKMDYRCIPRPPKSFGYWGERVVSGDDGDEDEVDTGPVESGMSRKGKAGSIYGGGKKVEFEGGTTKAYSEKLHSLLHPLRIRIGV